MTITETVVPGSAEHPARPAVPGPADPLGADILGLLRSLKLSGMKDTLPERLSLARSRQMSHATFLELLTGRGTAQEGGHDLDQQPDSR